MIRALEPLATSEETVGSIEFKEDVRYVWVDEDRRVMSTVHNSFGNALTWFINWQSRKRSIDAQLDIDNLAEWKLENLSKQRNALSKTGNPPANLMRVVLQARIESPSEAEAEIIQQTKDVVL